MKMKFTRARAIARKQTSRPGPALPLRGLVLAAGLSVAMAAGMAGAASAAAVTVAHPPVGSYTGTNPQTNGAIKFYVSSSKTSLQDISISVVYMTCTPGGAQPGEPFGIAAVPLTSNGSFNTTTTDTGVYAGGFKAKFTYTFQGSYQGLNSSGVPTFTGSFKETMKYTDSAARTCSSGTQSWTATRDAQPPQTTTPPSAGSYTATQPQTNGAITFYVSASKTSLQDISIPVVYLTCAPGGTQPGEPFPVASIPLASNGSFNSTTTQTGVYAGFPAKFTYTFRGNFHGAGPTGAARAAGTFRETMTYNDSTARSCTSNTLSWTALRDSQPPQTTSKPPAGGYTATNPQTNGAITFSVSSSRTSLHNVAISTVYMTCAPGGSQPGEPFAIAAIPIKTGLTFAATTTKSGVYQGHPAKFTYTFRGNFHGVNPSGAARAAGTFQETMTFTDSTKRTCNSNTLSWTAAHS